METTHNPSLPVATEIAGEFIKRFINQTWSERHGSPITEDSLTLIWSLLVSVFSIGGILGSVASGYLAGRFGKKKCQLCSCFLPMTSALLMGLSRATGLLEMILIGRFLAGFHSGLGLNIHAQYVGESAPRKLRGFINSTGPLFVTLGKLCGQVVGLRELFGTESLWPQLLLFSGIVSFVQLVTLPFFPESPSYLLLVKADKDGCVRALKQLWGEGDIQADIDEMMEEQAARGKGRNMTVLELLRDPSQRWQLCVLIGLILTMQLSGANAIYFYSYDVFRDAGAPPERIPYISLGVGTFELVSSVFCSLLINRFARKFLILGGYSLMVLTLGLLTVTLSLQHSYTWMPHCSVALVFTFIFLYGAGPAGATICMCVEIFMQAPRVPAFVISGSFSWMGMYLLGMVFPYMVGRLQHYSFLLFMAVIITSVTLIFLLVPETKGKSTAEISREFNKLNFRKQQRASRPVRPECVLSTKL
ncbi:solute carrier family 2, facilitated glucose transporter member 9-like isoform X2 [Ascaphus truei]|uniref:solute carrier family 2, facilitated glucose transporter member 9-like isoform X2 n=1 Tax=Ascaphus truei TaxID=8439 RepID=UPI003F59208B